MVVSNALRVIVPLAGGLLALAHFGIDHSGRALAVATAMVLAWLCESLHPAIVGFIGAFLFRAVEAAEFETAFGGFAMALPWLLFGVLLLVNAAHLGGLSRAVAKIAPASLSASPIPAGVALIAVALVLSWLMPQPLARAAVLIILVMALAPAEDGRRASLGAVAAMSSVMFELRGADSASLMLTASSAAALAAGALVIGRSEARPVALPESAVPLDRTIALIVILTILLWVAPSSRIQPELVGLGAGLLCAVVALVRGWRGVTADPLAMILAGTALSIPAVLKETGALLPLVNSVHHTVGAIGLPASLTEYWSWSALRLFMLDASASGEGASPAVWTIPTSAAATTLFALHQAPALALAMATCGTRARQVLTLGAMVFAVRSVLVLLF